MPHFDDEQLLPLSALNHLLFCERRAALIHTEQTYVHNQFTLEGVHGHQRADRQVEWREESGVRSVHAMTLISRRLGLSGKGDVVEFHLVGQPFQADGQAGKPDLRSGEVPYPVEYKRGKRKKWDNDDVQLCAQALCLEEMLGASVPRGAIFHIKSKRRREVIFTDKLRKKTEATAARLHELIASGVTPAAVLKPQCDGCSLREVCLPELGDQTARVERYCRELFQV